MRRGSFLKVLLERDVFAKGMLRCAQHDKTAVAMTTGGYMIRCLLAVHDGGLALGEHFADAFHLSAHGTELFFDALVTAVDVVDAIDDGFAIGDECGENE